MCVWLVKLLGRCETDALLRSVEERRFRQLIVVNIPMASCVTETVNDLTKYLLHDRWNEVIVATVK